MIACIGYETAEQFDVEPAGCILTPRLQEQSRTMIRTNSRLRTTSCSMRWKLETSVQAVLFVHGISQDWRSWIAAIFEV